MLKYIRGTSPLFLFFGGVLIAGAILGVILEFYIYDLFLLGFGIVFLILYFRNQIAWNRTLSQLKQDNTLNELSQDFYTSQSFFKDRLRLGEKYIFGKGSSVFLTYSEIYAVYEDTAKRRFFGTGRFLNVYTDKMLENRDSRPAILCHLKSGGEYGKETTQMLFMMKAHNPDIAVTAEEVQTFLKDLGSNCKRAVTDKQKHSLSAMEKLIASGNQFFVLVFPGLAKLWPAIDINGNIHIYTNLVEAEESADAYGFLVNSYSSSALKERLTEWMSRDGITRLRLHYNGTEEAFHYKDLGLEPDWNSTVQYMAIRFLQARKTAENTRKPLATAETWWSVLCNIIPQKLFLVPFSYEGESLSDPVSDCIMHLFPKAAAFLTEQQKKDQLPVFDGYSFAFKADRREMHFRTLKNQTSGEEWLSFYTSLQEINIWKGKAHYALATFDDMKDKYQPSEGLLLNPGSTGLRLFPEFIAEIEKARNDQSKLSVPAK